MVSEWHPILAATERQPGTWDMIDPQGCVYGRIQIRRVSDGIRYRAEHQGELLGWATSLRLACERVHQAYIRAHSRARHRIKAGRSVGNTNSPARHPENNDGPARGPSGLADVGQPGVVLAIIEVDPECLSRPECLRACRVLTGRGRNPCHSVAYMHPPVPSKPIERLMVYIDGYNLYYGMHEVFGRSTLWLDVVSLAQSFRPAQRLVGVKYFSAPVIDDPAAQSRQAHYIEALSAKYPQQFTPVLGRYQKKMVTCFRCGRQHPHYEEKETDVNIAVTLVADAARHEMDTAILISGDSDLAPAARAVGTIGAHLFVAAAFPPKRVSKHLRELMPASFSIDRKQIKRSQLPAQFTVGKQTFARPSYWQ